MLLACALAALLDFAQQPPRDAAGPKTDAGTATISGMVVTDDADRRPVRRARVSINEIERRSGATVVTDDAGRFIFRNVAAGRYHVAPSKAAWVGTPYGATRPGRPGTPIAVSDGQQIEKIVVRMARGGVISGAIVDQHGLPMARITVSPFRYAFQNGTRALVPAGAAVQTDDRGLYRLYGLLPGQYVVGATARSGFGAPAQPAGDFRQTTDGDIARALSARASPAAARAADPQSDDKRPTLTYAAMFYPGTPLASQATTITIGAGDERTGIDFPVALVPTSRVEGMVVDPEGAAAANIAVNIVSTEQAIPGFLLDTFRTSRTNAEGRFTFTGLAPGTYALMARAATAKEAAHPAAPVAPGLRPEMITPSLWAKTEVTVDGHSLTGLTLTMQQGYSVSGRLQFSGSLPPPDVTRIRVAMLPIAAVRQVNVGVSPGQVNADGTFTVKGLAPGSYRISAPVPGTRFDVPAWTLHSAIVDDRDVLDQPFDVNHNVGDVVLTYTDRAAELSGALQDPAGRPAPEYYIVVFAADRTFWVPQSRRVRAIRPSADGKYLVRNLPAGDYLIAAVSDIEEGEWGDPAVLQRLAGASMKVQIGEGEKKVQDIQIGAAR